MEFFISSKKLVESKKYLNGTIHLNILNPIQLKNERNKRTGKMF